MTTFDTLGLAEPILRAVAAEGYHTPTPIQARAIPLVLEGKDILGCAQTGTGKTAAFALPILHRLMAAKPAAAAPQHPGHHGHHARRRIRSLILSPTRELAVQIAESFSVYGKHSGLRHTVIYGGVGQGPQTQALRHGVDTVIATPGRLQDLMGQGYVDLSHVEIFVLDEADRMLDMGFIHDIRRIVEQLPTRRQTLMFSATMPKEIRVLAESILDRPAHVHIAPVASTTELVDQSVYFVDKRHKPHLLRHLLGTIHITRAIVFTRTKHGADRVVRQLHRTGIRAEAIHGDKTQGARQRALGNFKSGKTPILIATDIAARGIDVDDVSHVFNYDLPNEPETYVHRIGRTGRAGNTGVAIAFCDGEERPYLRDIQRLIHKELTVLKDHPEYPLNEEPPAPTPHAPHAPAQHTPRDRRPHAPAGASSHSHGGHGGQSHSGQGGKRRFFKRGRRPSGPGRPSRPR
jgi:ATP-dependent RNA helicase RhlE